MAGKRDRNASSKSIFSGAEGAGASPVSGFGLTGADVSSCSRSGGDAAGTVSVGVRSPVCPVCRFAFTGYGPSHGRSDAARKHDPVF